MFIRTVEIKNYRSLEAVNLEQLGLFNVLIGRNNSGKSSVFGALSLLNNVIRGQSSVDWNTILTGQDKRLSLEVRLVFEVSQAEREELLTLVLPKDDQKSRRLIAIDSPLYRKVEFHFRSPAGNPQMLHLRETRVLAEDGRWATVQKMISGDIVANPQSHFKQLAAPFVRQEPLITAEVLDVNNGKDITAVNVPHNYAGHIDNHAKDIIWPQLKLAEFLQKAYFFNPFRHSELRQNVNQTEQLIQNGSNLSQVLHTINSNNRPLFARIEQFVQAALPDLGILQTPLISNQTEVGFLSRDGGYFVRLHDMGGGIEQLLMVATVLLTTGDNSALFLEEPESHLHAGAQRFLIEKLHSGNRQVFLTTHSPTFVNLSFPSSMYQVKYLQEKTTIQRLEGREMLGKALADIGSRNSDVLLSNAVTFVEGPADRDAFIAISKTLGVSLDERNITVFAMGGGDQAEHKARVRSEVLAGISKQSPVPHLFILDRDERSQGEISKAQQALHGRLHMLAKRELENYLLVPRVLMQVIREKCGNDSPVIQQIAQTTQREIETLMQTTADSLYGVILLKRIRNEIGGLIGGLLTREMAIRLAPAATTSTLPQAVVKEIQDYFMGYLESLKIEAIVTAQKEALDNEWSEAARRLELAPGEEILEAVFTKFGMKYKKPEDTVKIASKMKSDEIPDEIKELIKKVYELPPT